MPRGVHKLKQTAFRLPEDLLAWLKRQAEREQRPRTAIVNTALSEYRSRHEDDEPPLATPHVCRYCRQHLRREPDGWTDTNYGKAECPADDADVHEPVSASDSQTAEKGDDR